MAQPIIAGNVPILSIGIGQIISVSTDENLAKVRISEMAGSDFTGSVSCRIMHSGVMENYAPGDYVIVQMTMIYEMHSQKIHSAATDMPKYVMGHYHAPALDRSKPRSINTAPTNNTRFTHKALESGMMLGDDGSVDIVTEGAPKRMLAPDGNGVFQDYIHDHAQNFHQTIANQSPAYLSRSHFGAFNAKDDDKQATMMPSDQMIVKRDFVNATPDMDRWTSETCGANAPLVGCNNSTNAVVDTKKTVWSRIVQSGTKRVTIDAGDEGDGIMTIRLDELIMAEQALPMIDVPTPAILGNISSLMMGDDGAFEICAGGQSLPAGNSHGFKLSYKPGSGLMIQCQEKITITHGDTDTASNSIVVDPDAGVDVTASKGFRVNGKHLATEAVVDWLDSNQAALCQVTMIGAPAPLTPKALADFTKMKSIECKLGGAISDGKGVIPPPLKKIMDLVKSLFSSV